MNADVHALAGAYALNAVAPEEAAAFRRHLVECPACRQEAGELQATAARLGNAVSEAPPAGLRDRVMEAVRRTRQLPPAAGAAPRHQRSWPRRLAVAAAVVVIGGGGLSTALSGLDDPNSDQRSSVAAVMSAPDARSAGARLRGGGYMTVVVSQRLHKAAVLHERLPPLPPSEVYQLWLLDRQGNARSADVLIDPEPADRQARVIARLRPGDRVAITREPAGGSDQPTSEPLAIVSRA